MDNRTPILIPVTFFNIHNLHKLLFCIIICCGFSIALSQNLPHGIVNHALAENAENSDSSGKLITLSGNLLIYAYKLIISEQLSADCNFSPTCSEFSKEAFKQFTFIKGLALTTDRLMRCNGNGGENMPAGFTNPVNASVFDLSGYYCFNKMYFHKHTYIDSLITSGDTLTIKKLDNYKHKSALLAGFYSAVLPGAGRLYLGYPSQAKSTFITNVALAASAAEILIQSESGFLTSAGIGLLSAFYLGNIWGTVSLAKKIEYDHFINIKNENKTVHNNIEYVNTNDTFNILEKARTLFTNKEYNKLYVYCLNIQGDAAKTNKEILILRWKSMVELQMFSECRKELAEYTFKQSELLKQVNELPESIIPKSPLKAHRLSSYCPGLGQIYAGYPLKGTISFLLNSACIFLGFKAIQNELYFNSILFGAYPLLKFYAGGKMHSYSLALKTNKKRLNVLKSQYLQVISSIEMH